MDMRRFNTIAIRFSMIAAMLAIEGATPVLATGMKWSSRRISPCDTS